jgi:hypothetical protein
MRYLREETQDKVTIFAKGIYGIVHWVEYSIIPEPNDISPNDSGGIEPALVHSSCVLVAASGRG